MSGVQQQDTNQGDGHPFTEFLSQPTRQENSLNEGKVNPPKILKPPQPPRFDEPMPDQAV